MTLKSPNYPKISLPEAIDRVKAVYTSEHTNAAPRDVIATAMGYSGISGASGRIISALSQYGLIENAGGELYKISEATLNILLYGRGESLRAEAIKQTALHPKIFTELKGAFPNNVPSDENLRAYLVKRGFHPNAVKDVIDSYKGTLEFLEIETRGMDLSNEESIRDVKNDNEAINSGKEFLREGISSIPSSGESLDKSSLIFQISRKSKVNIIFDGKVTQESVRKLIMLLEASVDVYPTEQEMLEESKKEKQDN